LPLSNHLVLDASLITAIVLPVPAAEPASRFLARAHGEGIRLLAPDLWIAEVASALRGAVYAKALTHEAADRSLAQLFQLGIETVMLDRDLAHRALGWAARLGQSKAYDSFYLALAEREETALWSADGRLVDRARQLKLSWVKLVTHFK
jgi:predicted nucleic acid-binding protein